MHEEWIDTIKDDDVNRTELLVDSIQSRQYTLPVLDIQFNWEVAFLCRAEVAVPYSDFVSIFFEFSCDSRTDVGTCTNHKGNEIIGHEREKLLYFYTSACVLMQLNCAIVTSMNPISAGLMTKNGYLL